jgi:hypothetical protein
VKSFALFAILAALATAGVAAARSASPNDGALSVKKADGRVVMIGRGVLIGRFDTGQVTIKDPNPNDGSKPIVTGADSTRSLGEKTTRYSGSNLRFRIIGGSFAVTVSGTDIDLSAVGRGMVTLNGTVVAGGSSGNGNGTYAVNGGPLQPFPGFVLTFPLTAATVGAGG